MTNSETMSVPMSGRVDSWTVAAIFAPQRTLVCPAI
jgi:hypothetical protein